MWSRCFVRHKDRPNRLMSYIDAMCVIDALAAILWCFGGFTVMLWRQYCDGISPVSNVSTEDSAINRRKILYTYREFWLVFFIILNISTFYFEKISLPSTEFLTMDGRRFYFLIAEQHFWSFYCINPSKTCLSQR